MVSDGVARARPSAATVGLVALTGLGVVVAVLLLPFVPETVRLAASSLGLVAGGVATAVCCGARARSLRGRPGARAWGLAALAAVIALSGNLWVALTGGDPIHEPSVVSNTSIAVGLTVAIGALMAFADVGAGSTDRVVLFLDGFVVGGALLIIVSATVFPDLLTSARGDLLAQVTTLLFPVLDCALATVAVLVVLRSPRSHRLALSLVGLGFVTYCLSDVSYAVGTANGTFAFGTPADLGWIVGYLLIAAAALSHDAGKRFGGERGVSPTASSAVVLGITVVAVMVQATLVQPGALGRVETGILVLVVTAAGARQVLLTHDNTLLRGALERRVSAQDADLGRMVRQQEALLSSVGEGIYGVDLEGRITFVNPVGARLLGHEPDQLTGASAHDLFHVPEEGDLEHPWSSCSVHRAIADAVETTLEEGYRRADGQVIPVESTAAPLFDDTEVRGAVVVFREISQRREVDRMKNEFLSVVSHELRTPLTAILGSLELVSSGELGALPAPVEHLVGVASRSSERLSRLINDLLDFERIESGTLPMRLTTVDAGQLVVHAVQQVQGMATTYGVEVVTGTLQGRITVDEDQVVQTLINLLGNAVKFSPAGSVVRAESHVVGAHVQLQVHDSGRGIPPDKLQSIFGRFEQVDSSDARTLGGTGLGLAISKSIVDRHGGRIWATSELGTGTTMTVSLPAARRRGKDGQGQTIVVHDEDPRLVEAYVAALGSSGYRPVGVVDPDDLLRVLARERPSMLLLDTSPGGGGARVLGQVADSPRHTDLVIVSVVSPAPPAPGADPDSNSDPADPADPAAGLVEPVDVRRLVATVRSAMAAHAPGGTVVLVEDDDELGEAAAAMLAEDGLLVVRAGSAAEAAEVADVHPDLVVLDIMLPDGDGRAVVADYRRRGILAGTPLVLFTAAPPAEAGGPALGEDAHLQKSRHSPDELRAQVLALVAVATPGRGRAGATQPMTGAPPSDVADRRATAVPS